MRHEEAREERAGACWVLVLRLRDAVAEALSAWVSGLSLSSWGLC